MLPRVYARVYKEQEATCWHSLQGFANPPSAIRNNLGAKLGFDALELGMP
jgi:hypothetical protein